MPITINGNGSITGITAGGLPDASITVDDIANGAITPAKLSTGAPTWDTSSRFLVGTSSTSSTCTAVLQGSSYSALDAGILRFARGTTTPLNGEALGYIIFSDSGHGDAAYIHSARDGGTWNSSTSRPTRLVLSTTPDGSALPVERLRIAQNGVIFASHANNADGIQAQNSSTSGFTSALSSLYFSGYAPNNISARFLYCGDISAVRAEIRGNGGLANYQANNVNLSDRNAKKDISLAADTWDCVKQWEIVNYRYKDQSDDTDLNLGVIAQQVAESCPEVITIFEEAKEATETEPAREERLGVKEQQMYWMAIKALQEGQLRIEQLEAKVAALEAMQTPRS